MKIKKVISTIVIFCFLNFAVTPAFARTEAEKRKGLEEGFLIAVIAVAFIGAIYMATRIGKDNLRELQQESTMLDKLPVDVEFGLDYTNAEFYNDSIFNNLSDQSRNEFGTPTLKMKISW